MKNFTLTTFLLAFSALSFGQQAKNKTNTNKFDLFVKTASGEILIDKNAVEPSEMINSIYRTYENSQVNLNEPITIKTSNTTLTGKYLMEKNDKYIFISFVYDVKENDNTNLASE